MLKWEIEIKPPLKLSNAREQASSLFSLLLINL